ncbi:acetolactate synthase large subunit [Antrihabitans cavernicola]|uniref:acetolactate synthase n=1 Tax=Antrihabitans cavernicola TaxID=2495913 RepID=A0A5A7S6L7_9NOCA|nr:acetolactate synthase large subunit [Spelaeibacter cavernicola]KAA0019499.1 acetolactate synthase large subunit [Spelaeibacter cavernicola]
MNGAESLIRTLVDNGVDTCFTNPGTSEMHFVAALDEVPEMRAVLALFEGVATGAADGYARMADKPAATLLHLGSGLGNGMANLHNARKGKVPIVNIVGDHATYHVQYDALLQSDIETVARNVSPWVRTSQSTEELGADAAEAVRIASGPPGQVATLVLPADVSWGEGGAVGAVVPAPQGTIADEATLDAIVTALGRGRKTAILLGRRGLREEAMTLAAQLAATTGARLLGETFPARMERGARLPVVERLAYLAELASVQLDGLEDLILIDTKAPVSFFAYPGKKSYLVPDGCQVHTLAADDSDVIGSLEVLAARLGGKAKPVVLQQPSRPNRPRGKLTADSVSEAVGYVLPEGAIVSDEAQTSGVSLPTTTAGAPRHDWLTLTGGAIGQGLPVAVGAAVACPDRPVLALQADGSAMYTIQSLWTMAREQLDVTVLILNNRAYSILNLELNRVGAGEPGPKAKAQLDLASPPIDFVAIGAGLGVPSIQVEDAENLVDELQRAFAEPGPHLIEAVIPQVFTPFRLKAMPRVLGSLEHLPSPLARAVKRRLQP